MSTSDASVAAVNSAGKVTAVGAGSAKVTVSYENDSRTVTFNINVKSVA